MPYRMCPDPQCEYITYTNESGRCAHCNLRDKVHTKLGLFEDMRKEISNELYNISPDDHDVRLHYLYVYNSLQYFTKVVECSKPDVVAYYRDRAHTHLTKYIHTYPDHDKEKIGRLMSCLDL